MKEFLEVLRVALTTAMAIIFTVLTCLTAWEMKDNLWNGMRERLLAGFSTFVFFVIAICCISGLIK